MNDKHRTPLARAFTMKDNEAFPAPPTGVSLGTTSCWTPDTESTSDVVARIRAFIDLEIKEAIAGLERQIADIRRNEFSITDMITDMNDAIRIIKFLAEGRP